VGPYECPVCLEYRHSIMICHTLCLNLFCATEVLEIIDKAQPCPMCRRAVLRDHDGTSHWRLAKLTPDDNYRINRIQYECPDCLEHLSLNSAKSHAERCSLKSRPHRPTRRNPWLEYQPVERLGIMSNPRPRGAPLVANGKDRLLIYFVNGRKVRTTMARAYKTAR